jgi:methyl-accepting chemotaxis protein
MQQDLGALLEETRKLSQAILTILTRLENVSTTVQTVDTVVKKVDATIGDVSASALSIKDEIQTLKALFRSVDERLNKISIGAGVQAQIDKLTQPDKPAPQERDNPDAN